MAFLLFREWHVVDGCWTVFVRAHERQLFVVRERQPEQLQAIPGPGAGFVPVGDRITERHESANLAARRTGVPVVAVSRGWTGENLKIRLYETLDRLHLRFMDHVVAVSDGQAEKVRRCPRRRQTPPLRDSQHRSHRPHRWPRRQSSDRRS